MSCINTPRVALYSTLDTYLELAKKLTLMYGQTNGVIEEASLLEISPSLHTQHPNQTLPA